MLPTHKDNFYIFLKSKYMIPAVYLLAWNIYPPCAADITGYLGKVGLNEIMVILMGVIISWLSSEHQHTISNKSSKNTIKIHYWSSQFEIWRFIFLTSIFFPWKCRAHKFQFSVVLQHILKNILIENPMSSDNIQYPLT